METNLKTLSQGKAVGQPMTPPVEQGRMMAMRSKVGFPRKTSSQTAVPQIAQSPVRRISSGPGQELAIQDTEEEVAPQKPTRSYSGPIPLGSKPRISSFASASSTRSQDLAIDEEPAPIKPPRPGPGPVPYASKPRTASNLSFTSPILGTQSSSPITPRFGLATPRNEVPDSNGASTPFMTPLGSSQTSSSPSAASANDYFGRHRAPSSSSLASSVAGKKKPPPPIPAKRMPSMQTQFVTALYTFAGQGADDLSFAEGDRIKIIKKSDSTDDWWLGELKGVSGSFPANYVRL